MWQMRGREHNASPLSLKGLPGPTTNHNDAHAPTSPYLCTCRCLPHHHASCTSLPPACTVSFFFFLLTSSFVVQSLCSHHLSCQQTHGRPLLPGRETTCSTTTAPATPYTARRLQPR